MLLYLDSQDKVPPEIKEHLVDSRWMNSQLLYMDFSPHPKDLHVHFFDETNKKNYATVSTLNCAFSRLHCIVVLYTVSGENRNRENNTLTMYWKDLTVGMSDNIDIFGLILA